MYRGFQLQLWESSILFKSKERQNFYVSFVNSTPKRSESNSLDREDHSWHRLFLFSSYKKQGIGPLIFQISNCTFLFTRASSFSPIESSYTSQILSHSMTLKRSFMRFCSHVKENCHKSSVLRPFDQNCHPPSWNNFWNFFNIELLSEKLDWLKSCSSLLTTYNRYVRITLRLPLTTHRNVIEPITGSRHL